MKMSHKLIILFSVLAILTTAAFSVFSYTSNLKNLNENIYTSLNTLADKMQSETEQQIELMEYSLEELTSNIEFMDAFYQVYKNENYLDSPGLASAQTIMSRIMYQAPLQSAFYRLSVYTRNGFYLTNLFEKTDAVVSFSDEAKETVNSLSYLDQIDADPFNPLIVCPHNDPWSAIRPMEVFTLVKAVIWHGDFIGYLELSASIEDLKNIFQTKGDDGIHTKAVFSDGRILYSSDAADTKQTAYDDMPSVHCYSKILDLDIYVAQDMSFLSGSMSDILTNSLTVIIPLLIVILALVVIISYRLTGSISRLSRKIKLLPADSLISYTHENLEEHVVKASDREMYDLEQSFNDLLGRLNASYANEVVLREGSLKARLNALQLQINPHFVYNTLNIISAKGMESGNEEITELCDQFASMLRYSTDIRSQTASIEDEIGHVLCYLNLCKARYEDRLDFNIDIPKQMFDLQVPKLTLQSLVENALKYGFQKSTGQYMVNITGACSDDELTLSIKDCGCGFEENVLKDLLENFRLIENGGRPDIQEKEGHLGIINTYLRLYYYSHGQIKMTLYNDNGAVVELKEKIHDIPDNAS